MTMTQAQLFLKAIDLDPSFSYPYYTLGANLPSGGSIQLLNGTTMTEAQLLSKSDRLNSSLSQAYFNLEPICLVRKRPAAQWNDDDSSAALSKSHQPRSK